MAGSHTTPAGVPPPLLAVDIKRAEDGLELELTRCFRMPAAHERTNCEM